MNLSAKQQQEINDIVAGCEFPRGALLPVLHYLQQDKGYLSENDLCAVAEALNIPPVEVFGTATFYALFHTEPTGANVILACNNISCHLRGAEMPLARLQKELGIAPGQTTGDKKFTLYETSCLGACDRGPAMMINGRMYYELTPDKIGQILAQL